MKKPIKLKKDKSGKYNRVFRPLGTIDKILIVLEVIAALSVLITRPYFLYKGEREL